MSTRYRYTNCPLLQAKVSSIQNKDTERPSTLVCESHNLVNWSKCKSRQLFFRSWLRCVTHFIVLILVTFRRPHSQVAKHAETTVKVRFRWRMCRISLQSLRCLDHSPYHLCIQIDVEEVHDISSDRQTISGRGYSMKHTI
jgi:hypothetical protein